MMVHHPHEYENVLATLKPTVYLGVLPNDSFNLYERREVVHFREFEVI